jgi:hypothetical protein
MSFLTLMLSEALNLNKVTISLWFRIPKETADAVQWLEFQPDFEVFDGVIPFLVFGRQKNGTVSDFEDQIVGYNPDPVHGTVYVGGRSCPMAPTFIGVDKDGFLVVHIQTGDIGVQTQTVFSLTKYELIDIGGGAVAPHLTYTDYSSVDSPYPDSLGNDGYPHNWGIPHGGAREPEDKLAFDQWHHLLLSWDLGGSNACHGVYWGSPGGGATPGPDERHKYVDAASTMYCAVDDSNRVEKHLPGYMYPGMLPNQIISYLTYSIAGTSNVYGPPSSGISGVPTAQPEYNVSFAAGVPADGVFIPAELSYNISYGRDGGVDGVTPIKRIEMAEFQLFTGIALDTGVEFNRRAFADYERDKDGNIIYDKDGKKTLKPVNPKKAEELLGKKPEILLHGSSKWIAGKNTGTTGVDYSKDPPAPIPSGQFVPTAKINKYKPDPSLQKDSGA